MPELPRPSNRVHDFVAWARMVLAEGQPIGEGAQAGLEELERRLMHTDDESNPFAEELEIVWSGRTGAGQVVRLSKSDDWVQLVYYERDGTLRGGFALNRLYTGQLTAALTSILVDRAEAAIYRR
jgi:hypothetical protein